MFALAALQPRPTQPLWLGDGSTDPNLHDAFEECWPIYSAQLKYLINDCIEFDPSHRMTFERLVEDIEELTDEAGENLAGNVRYAERNEVEDDSPDRLSEKRDAYLLGLALP